MFRKSAEPPRCPFCGQLINRPRELKTRKPTEFPMGSCSCGAVYAYDVTGHNVGAAMVEALVFACDGDWDLAWNLLPEEDYLDARIENYDEITHQVIPGRSLEGRNVWGVLFFIRLHEDIREVTDKGVQAKLAEAMPIPYPNLHKVEPPKAFSKKEVQRLVEQNKTHELIAMAEEDTRVIRALHRLLYSVDELMRWRAIEMLGRVAGKLADRGPGLISELLRRLFSASSDSAASSWGALEAIGEIISNRPDLFGEFTRPLLSFLQDETSRTGALWAVGRIGGKRPDLVRYAFPHLLSSLDDPRAVVRGYAVWSLGEIGRQEARDKLERLKNDNHGLRIYEKGELKEKTVGEIAIEALEKLTHATQN
ncbi:MAG TPA: PBS lyase [Syntrophaceae bacterium]|nr:PBS lyase [Syntrophaceae bacterium]